jgi:hypothetical protein
MPQTGTATTKKWGQQCGVNCGCILRLELLIDQNDTIIKAQYTAKKIIANRKQEPILTTKGRLMLQSTSCETLHHLSEATVRWLSGKKTHRLPSEIEFHGLRSSSAFRQTVLSTHGLTGDHCFDLVEDVLTAVFRGFVPAPRKNYAQHYQNSTDNAEFFWTNLDEFTNKDVDTLDFNYGRNSSWSTFTWWPWGKDEEENSSSYHLYRNTHVSSKPKNAWSTLSWMDWVELERNLDDDYRAQVRDWLSYVDLQHEERA